MLRYLHCSTTASDKPNCAQQSPTSIRMCRGLLSEASLDCSPNGRSDQKRRSVRIPTDITVNVDVSCPGVLRHTVGSELRPAFGDLCCIWFSRTIVTEFLYGGLHVGVRHELLSHCLNLASIAPWVGCCLLIKNCLVRDGTGSHRSFGTFCRLKYYIRKCLLS